MFLRNLRYPIYSYNAGGISLETKHIITIDQKFLLEKALLKIQFFQDILQHSLKFTKHHLFTFTHDIKIGNWKKLRPTMIYLRSFFHG